MHPEGYKDRENIQVLPDRSKSEKLLTTALIALMVFGAFSGGTSEASSAV